MKELYLIPLRTCLLTIQKAFVRSHLDHADIINDIPENESFQKKTLVRKI